MAKPNHNPNEAAPRTTRASVFVACKLPHGLVIRDHVEGTARELVLGGGARDVKVFRPVGAKVFIKGPLRPQTDIVGGYAITENIDAGVFERWMGWNEDSIAVQNNMIFGHEDRDRVEGWAKEHAGLRSGLEALDVSMVRRNERMVISDSRVAMAGASNVIDGKVDAA